MVLLLFPDPMRSGRGFRRSLMTLTLLAAVPAVAQYPGGAVIQRLPSADDPAEKLAAALRTLAVSPRDLAALIEAGRDALTLGDPNAAVGFFGRASEVSPRDGRVKAGLGAALVQLEKPRDALRYFEQAAALGVPDGDLAEDRGLAYDLIGDTARAQRDYRTVLAADPDDEAARRRLALSQGIGGDRAAAIATLDPLIRKRDIAAWRAQTFVLAMTGDAKGANDITRVMLPQQQAMLQPFLERLATLSPADKARAVHFGEMPAAGRSYDAARLAAIGTPATYATPTVAARPAPVPTAPPPAIATAPRPAAVTASAPVAAPRTVAAPAIVAATTPRPQSGEPRYVSADGVPMRRIEHSAQEMFTLGLPRYEYVPASGQARPARRQAAAVAPSTPPPATVATPTATSPAVATTLPVVTPATPGSGVAAIALPAATAPSPMMASAQTGAGLAMPLGASGAEGHFDLPHEIANRRAVPRAVQATARPAVASTPRPSASPPPIVQLAAPDAAPNPAVAIARRARSRGTTDLALADRPTRRARPADSGTASAESDTVPDETTRPPTRKESNAARGSDAGKASSRSDVADKTSDRKGKSDDRARHKPARADDDDGSDKVRDRDRSHAKAKPGDDDAVSDKAGKAKSRDKTATRDDDKTSTKTKGKDKAADKQSAVPKLYVQVAGGANKADMDKAWAGVKAKAPELMKGRTPSTTPLHATNRLLVGPFKDEDEAQAFVNKMAGKGLSGFTFKSGKGQKVEKVDAGK